MVSGALGKVMWVGRATIFLVGLAVVLALLFGAATTALAHSNVDNKLFHLGHSNSAAKPTSLIGTLADAATSALIVQNKSGGAALDLRVGNATTPANDVAPMTVNSNKVVTNLNADKLDDKEASDFYAVGSKVADSEHADRADVASDAARLEGNGASAFQRRVSGECQEGTSIRAIGADGSSVICEPDDDGSTEQVSALRAELGSNDGAPNEGSDPVSLSQIRDIPQSVMSRNADTLDGKDSSEFASAYKRTVVVSPTGTDAQNGTTLINALSGITDASASKPYLLYIEPGTYNLSNGSLAMKPHVDIQGAGELRTVITSTVGDCRSGTVNGANNAELRFLTVRNTGTTGCNVAIRNDSAHPLITHVRAESTGGGGLDHLGVWNFSSNPTMTNVTATASGGTFDNYGMVNTSSSPTIRHSSLSGSSYSLYHNGGTAKVALTQLVGTIAKPSGTLQCFDNYNDSLAAVSCP